MKAKNNSLVSVFPTNTPPPREVVRQFPGDNERDQLQQLLQGQSWTEITMSRIRKYYKAPISEAFVSLTPRGQAYYLPAFLSIAEKREDEAGDLSYSIFKTFSARNEHRNELCGNLTLAQREYLIDFFEREWSGDAYYTDRLKELRSYLNQ